jgi:protein-arginine kinase
MNATQTAPSINIADLLEALKNSTSLLARHLDTELAAALRRETSSAGWRFDQLINSGLVVPESKVGVYVGDADSYRAFAPLLDRIIDDYHGLAARGDSVQSSLEQSKQSPDFRGLEQLDILSTRIRVIRNLAGHDFPPLISADERRKVETAVSSAFAGLPTGLQGCYIRIADMTVDERDDLRRRHLLFADPDPHFQASGIARAWPDARGLFRAHGDELSAWVNEEDHLRIIALRSGADIEGTFRLLGHFLSALESTLHFARDEKLGYLASCPSNLGTGLRASVLVRLPGLGQDLPRLKCIAGDHELQVRGQHGESGGFNAAVFDISNARRLGPSADSWQKSLADGLHEIAAIESGIATE